MPGRVREAGIFGITRRQIDQDQPISEMLSRRGIGREGILRQAISLVGIETADCPLDHLLPTRRYPRFLREPALRHALVETDARCECASAVLDLRLIERPVTGC